ncbi:MAG TPA: hypothetical protein VJN91_09750 [Gammaproteobacteria bacterium]|nr:hypothetical protein [Gammaproteobacteria bacterium]
MPYNLQKKLILPLHFASTKQMLLVLISSLALLVMRTANSADAFSYHPPIRAKSEEFSFQTPKQGEGNGHMIYGGDAYFETKYCPQESEYICVFSPYYAFAVPKDLSETNSSEWEVDGFVFKRRSGREQRRILGSYVDDVYVIETPPEAFYLGRKKNKPTLSLYSPTIGLIGFVDIRFDDFYWLTGRVGFGAQGKTPITEDQGE